MDAIGAVIIIVGIPTLVVLEILVIKEWDRIMDAVRSRRRRKIMYATDKAFARLRHPSAQNYPPSTRDALAGALAQDVCKLLTDRDLHV